MGSNRIRRLNKFSCSVTQKSRPIKERINTQNQQRQRKQVKWLVNTERLRVQLLLSEHPASLIIVLVFFPRLV